MKKTFLLIFLLAVLAGYAREAVEFDKYFLDQTLRVDVFHTGDAREEMFTIDRVIQEGPGPATRAIPSCPSSWAATCCG